MQNDWDKGSIVVYLYMHVSKCVLPQFSCNYFNMWLTAYDNDIMTYDLSSYKKNKFTHYAYEVQNWEIDTSLFNDYFIHEWQVHVQCWHTAWSKAPKLPGLTNENTLARRVRIFQMFSDGWKRVLISYSTDNPDRLGSLCLILIVQKAHKIVCGLIAYHRCHQRGRIHHGKDTCRWRR